MSTQLCVLSAWAGAAGSSKKNASIKSDKAAPAPAVNTRAPAASAGAPAVKLRICVASARVDLLSPAASARLCAPSPAASAAA